MKLKNKEKLKAEISKCTDFIKKHPAALYVLMHRSGLIEARKYLALTKAYSDMQKHYDTYRRNVVKRFTIKKSWPRTRQKKFHQMRVGA